MQTCCSSTSYTLVRNNVENGGWGTLSRCYRTRRFASGRCGRVVTTYTDPQSDGSSARGAGLEDGDVWSLFSTVSSLICSPDSLSAALRWGEAAPVQRARSTWKETGSPRGTRRCPHSVSFPLRASVVEGGVKAQAHLLLGCVLFGLRGHAPCPPSPPPTFLAVDTAPPSLFPRRPVAGLQAQRVHLGGCSELYFSLYITVQGVPPAVRSPRPSSPCECPRTRIGSCSGAAGAASLVHVQVQHGLSLLGPAVGSVLPHLSTE